MTPDRIFDSQMLLSLIAVVALVVLCAWAWKRANAEGWDAAKERLARIEYERELAEWKESVEYFGYRPDPETAELLDAIDNGTYRVPPAKAPKVMAAIFPDSARWNRRALTGGSK